MEQVNVWHVFLKNDLNNELLIKILKHVEF